MRTALLMLTIVATATLARATVSVSLSNSSESFALQAGSSSNAGNASITATTTYQLSNGQTLYVIAYFASSTAALTDGAGHNIPASAFYISDNGGSYQSVSNTLPSYGDGCGQPTANAGLLLHTVAVTNSSQHTVTDPMTFNINLSGGTLPQLPAGTYTGTLYIQGRSTMTGHQCSSAQAITLTATISESLTVSLSGNTVTFPLTAGSASNAGNTSITATTTWVLQSSRTTVTVYAYFASATAALTNGGTYNIPSSAFFISDNSGAFAALTNTVAFGGANAGLSLGATAISSTTRSSTRKDTMSFNINLTGSTLPQLPAGTYTGTLNIEAQATP